MTTAGPSREGPAVVMCGMSDQIVEPFPGTPRSRPVRRPAQLATRGRGSATELSPTAWRSPPRHHRGGRAAGSRCRRVRGRWPADRTVSRDGGEGGGEVGSPVGSSWVPAVAPAAGGAGQGAQRSCGVREVGAGSGGAHPGQLLTPPRPGLAFGAMPLASSGEDAGDAEPVGEVVAWGGGRGGEGGGEAGGGEPVGEVVAVGVGERAASPAARIGAGQADVVESL